MPDINNSEITIFSVYHSEKTKRFTELNYETAGKLNPGVNFHWVVGDNSPVSLGVKIDKNKFEVIEGFPELPPGVPDWCRPSFFHTLALNKIAAQARPKSRFVLIIDADFLIIYPDWIESVIGHMKENNLAFLGAPYHPRDYTKTRYFPSVVCLFIDTEKIDLRSVDFRPQYPDVLSSLDGKAYPETWTEKVFKKIRKLSGLYLGRRFKVRTSRDSGYGLYKKYYKSDFASECLTPVFKSKGFAGGPKVEIEAKDTFIEKFLPDRLSFIPKKPGYFSETGFRERGYFDIVGLGLEEYLWNDRPFGFHFRGTYVTKRTPEEEANIAEEAVRNLIGN